MFGEELLAFRYAVVGLPDLPAEDYRESENPLGPALSVAMRRPASLARFRLKYDALLRTARSEVDDARKALLTNVIENFLPLRGSDLTEYERLVARDEAAEVREMISVYERRGREEGLRQGLQQGKRETLLQLLRVKFGDLPTEVTAHVEAVEEVAELDALLRRLLTAETLDEMGLTSAPDSL